MQGRPPRHRGERPRVVREPQDLGPGEEAREGVLDLRQERAAPHEEDRVHLAGVQPRPPQRVPHRDEDRGDPVHLRVPGVGAVGVQEGRQHLVEGRRRHRRVPQGERAQGHAHPRRQLHLEAPGHVAQAQLQRLGHRQQLRDDPLLLLRERHVERLEPVLPQQLRQQHPLHDRGVDVVAPELLVAGDREVGEVQLLLVAVRVDPDHRHVARPPAEVEDEHRPGVRQVEEPPVLGAGAAGQQVVEEGRVGLVEERLLGERKPGESRRPERVLAGGELEGRRHRHHRPRQRVGPHLGLDRPGQLREHPPRHLEGRVVLARGGEGVERLPPQPHLGLRGVEDLPPAQQPPAARLAGAPPHPPLPRRHLRHHGREQRARDRPVRALLPDRQHRDGGVGVPLQQGLRVHDGHRRVRRPEVDAHVVAGLLEPALDLPAPPAGESRRQGRRAVGRPEVVPKDGWSVEPVCLGILLPRAVLGSNVSGAVRREGATIEARVCHHDHECRARRCRNRSVCARNRARRAAARRATRGLGMAGEPLVEQEGLGRSGPGAPGCRRRRSGTARARPRPAPRAPPG